MGGTFSHSVEKTLKRNQEIIAEVNRMKVKVNLCNLCICNVTSFSRWNE